MFGGSGLASLLHGGSYTIALGLALPCGKEEPVHKTGAPRQHLGSVLVCTVLGRERSPAEGRGQGQLLHLGLGMNRAGACGSTAFLQDQS